MDTTQTPLSSEPTNNIIAETPIQVENVPVMAENTVKVAEIVNETPLSEQTMQVEHDKHISEINTATIPTVPNGNTDAVSMECDESIRSTQFVVDVAGDSEEYKETFDAELEVRKIAPVDKETIKHDDVIGGVEVEPPSSDDSSEEESESDDSSDDSDSDSEMEVEDLETVRKKIMMSLDEDGGPDGPLKTANELDIEELPEEELPPVLPTDASLIALGKILSMVDKQLVVQATEPVPTMDLGTAFYLSRDSPLGTVFDVFGQVGNPYYTLRAREEHTKDLIGQQVFYCPHAAQYVMPSELRKMKGTDASGTHDEEVMPEEMEYSDDEMESQAKRDKKKANNQRKGVDRGNKPNRERGGFRGRRGDGRVDRDDPSNNRNQNSWLGQYEGRDNKHQPPQQHWGQGPYDNQQQQYQPNMAPQQQRPNYGQMNMNPSFHPQPTMNTPMNQGNFNNNYNQMQKGPFVSAMPDNRPMSTMSPWDNAAMYANPGQIGQMGQMPMNYPPMQGQAPQMHNSFGQGSNVNPGGYPQQGYNSMMPPNPNGQQGGHNNYPQY